MTSSRESRRSRFSSTSFAARAARAADPGARGCLVCNSVAELVGVHEQLGPLLEGAVRKRIGSVERLLRQAAAQGELAEQADCAAVARSTSLS